MRGRCCPLLRAFWGAVDERDRFTWKQVRCQFGTLCSPSRSLSVPVTCPEANSISVISGLPCLFKFNLNFEKEEKSKMKLGTNTVHKIVHTTSYSIHLHIYFKGINIRFKRTTPLPTKKNTLFPLACRMIGTKGAAVKNQSNCPTSKEAA